MPSVPITGLSGLGAALSDAGADYLGRTRQLQDQERARANLLADVASQESRADTRYNRARSDQLADVESSRAYDRKVATQRRGEQLYDTQDARDYAEAHELELHARQLREIQPDRNNAQRLVDDAAKQLATVRQRAESMQAKVTANPPQVSPNDQSVLALAQQLAGGSKNREEIALMVPKAVEQLNGEAMVRHSLNVRAAQEALQSLRNTEAQLTDLIQQGMTTFRVAPNTPPPVSMLTEPTANAGAPKGANAAQIAAAMDAAFGGPGAGNTAVASRSAPPAALQDPLADAEASGLFTRPINRQGRATIFAPTTPEVVDTAAQSLQAELARLQSAPPSRATAGRVAYLNDILNRLGTKKKELLGVPSIPAPVATPPPTPGAMLSNPIGASLPAPSASPGGRWWEPQGAAPAFGF